MDLIYTNTEHVDEGVFKNYKLDLAFGSDENDFELTLDVSDHCCTPNALIYIEGTEYGGIIDGLGVVTSEDKLSYVGRTWHGILNSKVIAPQTVSGDAHQVVESLLNKLGLSDLFVVSQDSSAIVIENYQFEKHIFAYSGISKMLESVQAKLKFMFTDGHVVLSVLPVVDYSQDEQFDNDSVELDIEQRANFVNHLICIEKSENGQGAVTHLYKDVDGTISDTQTISGLREITDMYEGNSEDGTEKIRNKIRKYY